MLIIMLGIILAFLLGLSLSIYFFVYRLNLSKPWCWLCGIGGGLILGLLMAVVDFLVISPPVSILSAIVGLAIIAFITLIVLVKKPINYQVRKPL